MLPSAAMATARYPSQLMAASAFTSPLTRGGGGGANPHDLHSISRASVAASKSTIQIRSILVNNVAHPITQSFPAFRSTFSGKAYRATRPRATLHAVSVAEERSIAVGEKLPDAELSYLDKSDNIQTVRVSDITRGKKVIIFAVPGAFTPTCTQKHVPGFLEKAEELKAKGVDTIACVSVNDVFVMKAWGESLAVNDKILLLSDGSAEFTNALGVTLDLTGKPQGLGVRSRRYALLAEDGVVKVLNLEEGGSFTVSSAEEISKAL